MAQPSHIDTQVAKRIREFRKKAGHSQSQLAHDLGVSLQQVQKYEAGVNRISAGRLYDIAFNLGVPVQVLFPEVDSLASQTRQRLDPEREVLSFLSNGQNWQLYCAFRRILDVDKRSSVIELAQKFAG